MPFCLGSYRDGDETIRQIEKGRNAAIQHARDGVATQEELQEYSICPVFRQVSGKQSDTDEYLGNRHSSHFFPEVSRQAAEKLKSRGYY